MTAAWPLVVDRLVQLLPSLTGWDDVAVFDGPPVTQDAPANYLTIGFVLGEDAAGEIERITHGVAGMLEELGSIRCELVCTTGETDLSGMRAKAFALVDSWQAEVSRDQSLGVLSPSSTTALSVEVLPAQTDAGASQRLVVTLNYFSRS